MSLAASKSSNIGLPDCALVVSVHLLKLYLNNNVLMFVAVIYIIYQIKRNIENQETYSKIC